MLNKDEISKRIHELKSLKVMAEELASEITSIEDEIKQTMNEQGTDTLIVDVYKITYKAVTSTRLDSAALKTAMPELNEQYSKQTTSKRFLVC